MIFIDSHCHIDGEQFDEDRDEMLERAAAAGVKMMLTVGTGNPHDGEIERAVTTAEQYANVYASVGVHPHDAKFYDDAAEERLINLARNSPKVIAWGEIGLDFYYDYSPRDVQEDVFRRQIRTARDLELPIIVHSREADVETVRVLTEECAAVKRKPEIGEQKEIQPDLTAKKPDNRQFRGGIMHCFGGTAAMARDLMEIGFLISFAGNVTFKKADNLRDAARIVPLDKLLIETDCPFLAPVPHRGKRSEPAFVADTAGFLAELYNIELETLAAATTRNFIEFFNVSPPD